MGSKLRVYTDNMKYENSGLILWEKGGKWEKLVGCGIKGKKRAAYREIATRTWFVKYSMCVFLLPFTLWLTK